MSIQLKVKKEDIPTEWEQGNRVELVPDRRCLLDECPHCGGNGCLVEVRKLLVKFPESGWAMSYLEDELMIDNGEVNHQFREELEKWGVPYIRGMKIQCKKN